jgi:hypothetical protein
MGKNRQGLCLLGFAEKFQGSRKTLVKIVSRTPTGGTQFVRIGAGMPDVAGALRSVEDF